MAFKLTEDQRHDFQAVAGTPVTVGVQAPATTLQAGGYNDSVLPMNADGTVTFTPILGSHFLTLVVAPPFPPEAWNVVEVDGAHSQLLQSKTPQMQIAVLIIVGR